MIESLQQWWKDAGVDQHFDDEPHALLNDRDDKEPTKKPEIEKIVASKTVETQESVGAPVPSPDMPVDYEDFLVWLSERSHLVENGCPGKVVLPFGKLNPAMMVVTAMPDRAENENSTIFSHQSQMLVKNMLAAMGIDSENAYFATISVMRPMDSRIPSKLISPLKARFEHLLKLVQPEKIILFGNSCSQIFFEQELLSARQKKLFINHHTSKTEAIVTFHPRTLLERPEIKAEAWNDLQLLMGTNKS
ncbi:MAG: uracil-DNA glycosylase family protein [Parasphingorhabdus sp.]